MEIEVTWSKVLKVWWAFAWRVFAVTFVVGSTVGIAGKTLGYSQAQINFLNVILGYIFSAPVGIYMMRYVFKMKFKDFRIVLLANKQEGDKDNA